VPLPLSEAKQQLPRGSIATSRVGAMATVEHGEEPTDPSDDQVRRFDELIVPEMPFLARIARAMSHSQAEADDLA